VFSNSNFGADIIGSLMIPRPESDSVKKEEPSKALKPVALPSGVPATSPRPTLTIVEAITEAMKRRGAPANPEEVYRDIISAGLYEFKADDPVHVIRSQIRRHSLGLSFSSASATKYFSIEPDGKYYFIEAPVRTTRRTSVAKTVTQKDSASEVRSAHQRYVKGFKQRALDAIHRLRPTEFEHFCRNLLEAYGFRDVKVSRVGKDGGIDGFGKLKVGFAFFSVAFQCKKWRQTNVGRPDIDQFRGAIQGQYEQGMFFTTARFTPDARNSAFKPGAVTIVLIDGPTIVDIMVDKGFGVETEELRLYSLALDLAIAETG
jgi:restriction system protein